jgi:hypothetical protein
VKKGGPQGAKSHPPTMADEVLKSKLFTAFRPARGEAANEAKLTLIRSADLAVKALALRAVEAAGTAAAAVERTLAATAFGAMGRVAAGALRMTLALLGTLTWGRTLLIAAALAGRLDSRAGSRRATMTMAIVATFATEPTAAAATLIACSDR